MLPDPTYGDISAHSLTIGYPQVNSRAATNAVESVLRRPNTVTYTDFGPMFEGETVQGEEVYIRRTSRKYPRAALKRFPSGQITTDEEGRYLFIYGSFAGADVGFFPPVNFCYLVYGNSHDHKSSPCAMDLPPLPNEMRDFNLWLNNHQSGEIFLLQPGGGLTKRGKFASKMKHHPILRAKLDLVIMDLPDVKANIHLRLDLFQEDYDRRIPAGKVMCAMAEEVKYTDDPECSTRYALFFQLVHDVLLRRCALVDGAFTPRHLTHC